MKVFDFCAFLAKDSNGESFVSSWSFLTKVSRCRCGCDVINCKEILRHRERVLSAQKDKKQRNRNGPGSIDTAGPSSLSSLLLLVIVI